MPAFIVEGGHRLQGSIRPAGTKNAALPAVSAALLTAEPVTLNNVPRIRDVLTLLELIETMGADVTWEGANTVTITASGVTQGRPDPELAERIRASVLLAGPLLARFGNVCLPPPGGDVIGRRRLDTHFLAFERLGAEIRYRGGFEISATTLRGTDIFLDEPSVTASENAIMAAVLAKGTTTLRNAASEPHVQDLCLLLNQMGARIRGIGLGTLAAPFVLAPSRFRKGRRNPR